MSVLERCPSYRESNKGSQEKAGTNSRCPFYRGDRFKESQIKGVKKRQGPTLGVRFTEVYVLKRVK